MLYLQIIYCVNLTYQRSTQYKGKEKKQLFQSLSTGTFGLPDGFPCREYVPRSGSERLCPFLASRLETQVGFLCCDLMDECLLLQETSVFALEVFNRLDQVCPLYEGQSLYLQSSDCTCLSRLQHTFPAAPRLEFDQTGPLAPKPNPADAQN